MKRDLIIFLMCLVWVLPLFLVPELIIICENHFFVGVWLLVTMLYFIPSGIVAIYNEVVNIIKGIKKLNKHETN